MGGTTLTIVPSGVGSPLAMHRSQSTPDFFAPAPSPNSLTSHHQNLSSKSLPDLPDNDVAAIDIDFNIDFDSSALCFGTDFLDSAKQEQQVQKAMAIRPDVGSDSQKSPRGQKNASNLYVASEKKISAKDTKTTRTWTLTSRPKSWLPGFRPAPDTRDTSKEYQKAPSPDPEAAESAAAGDDRELMVPIERSRTASGSFPSYSRTTERDPYSRSPSPPRIREPLALDGGNRNRSSSDSSAKAKLTKRRPASTIVEMTAMPTESAMPRPKRTSTFFSIRSRPQNVFSRTVSTDDCESFTSSETSFAQTTGDASASQPSSEGGDTTVTDDTSATSDVPASPMAPQRDPLWRVFKNLETEYAKFEPKPASVRMTFLRSILIPFLRVHASHPSNRGLKPALLEFRANILDKWWNGMLQMLDGRKVGHVPGADRTELLEMITMVMMRPEWRQSATYFLPLVDRSPSERVKALRARSFTSISDEESTSSSEFFDESALHNVRTMFIANLIKQMTIVIDKLSLRNTSPSLINFAGKASAYAFAFAPGCAEVLVRLWGLTPDLIRRAADEFGLPRKNNGESEDICALFPPCVQPLGWTSVKFLSEYLKQPARLPPLVARANWYGPWGSKWRGKESDVFYIFVKYFYRLSEEFMPSGLPLIEKARSPAFVLVQAQMLGVLDETIHRRAAFDAMMGLPFGDSLDGADASVTALAPFGSSNLLKGMDQNRMIMLLKNFIADHSILASRARESFAEAFMCLAKAATKRTSQFDHSACFTLCDFLEEALSTFTSEKGYYDISRLVDWPFWFDVCRKILDNENTMSTVRVLSFVFTMWDVIVVDSERKEALCRDWLVSEDMFTKLFTHWCPMVRAYYMRLLCWRICRDSGRSDEADIRIFQLVAKHLKTVFHNYEWLRSIAETQRKFLPSTAPCYPTPGKKFMIIRTQVGSPLPGTVPRDFDAFSTSFTTPSGVDGPVIQPPTFSPPDPQPRSEGKKRWSLLGKVLSLNTANAQRTTMDEDLEAVRREMAASRRRSASPTGPPPPPKPGFATPASEDDEESNPDSPTPRGSDYVFKFVLSLIPPHIMPPLERILRRPRLPAPAQARVLARESSSNDLVRPGLPAATRRYSGAGYTGLVAGARNADPTDEVYDHSPCDPSERSSFSSRPSFIGTQESPETAMPSSDEVGLKPEGREKMARAKYTGKALAEWGLVVAECNAFVERRRDEGMHGLADVEVPQLGVEWFQKFA